jgi:hypothetical protein
VTPTTDRADSGGQDQLFPATRRSRKAAALTRF